ncbi:hypothetical protein Poli38472_009799 [Pythium oligandrum]|uniref:ABC transporter domain-containing protein n=1 Tax=Pythium oligandrum TaxID=41045 RepID=A0A8K1CGB8_PYTOL|nr:hypothetical protein Poli38472_009799 [Pythium oligandrum]|eukprot:TMW62306.1 hypothetical protein Poli38472_009799 [Pythium oligandrum]
MSMVLLMTLLLMVQTGAQVLDAAGTPSFKSRDDGVSSSGSDADVRVHSSLSMADTCDRHYEQWNATTKACECKDGFYGMECQMCRSSDVCQVAFQGEADKYTCATGLTYHETSDHKTYDCVLDPALQQLFNDGALAVHCDRATKNCTAAVFKAKDTVRGYHVINCHLSSCEFSNGSGNGRCGLIECKCGSACSPVTKAIVETSLSGKPANITVSKNATLSIDIEGSPIPLAATCKASACEVDKSGGSSSASSSGSGDDDDKTPNAFVLALIISAALAGVILVGVCCCSCFVKPRHGRSRLASDELESELRALGSTSGKVLDFKRINCRITDNKTQETKRILYDISGCAKRGQVVGLLGPSGSGKTSLLNALAAVENGRCQVTGEVKVDNKKIARDYRKIAAYVQQDDALFATLTVRECLLYSAELRLPSTVPEVVKHEMVTRILTELNLIHVEHSRIGGIDGTDTRGISGGERRRVSIGMELVTSPQILFLDEPTSGLDSFSANSVVQLLKELANHGRIVVLSVHQPSTKAFMLLDQVILLAKGKMLYNGAPQEAKNYFEDIGFKCPENENVADFILDIASNANNIPMVRAVFKQKHPEMSVPSAPPTPSKDDSISQTHSVVTRTSRFFRPFAAESSPFMSEDASIDTPRLDDYVMSSPIATPTPATPAPPRFSGPGSPAPMRMPSRSKPNASQTPQRSLRIEVGVLFRRTSLNILRHRSLLMLHLTLSVVLALFAGLIFNHVTNDLAGFQNRSGAFYFILTFFGFASMSSMDLFIAERAIFLRETGAMYYGAFSYFLAKAVLDTCLLRILPATLFASIFYWIMGLQSSLQHFLYFLATLVLFNVAAGSISILVGVICRRVGTANLSATVVFLVMLLFGGFLLNSQTMPKSVGWIKHFSIFSYAFEILMTNELKGLLLKFDAPGYPSVPVYGDVFLKTLGMDYANRYYDLVALATIAFSLQVLSFLFLSLQVPMRQELVEEMQPEKYVAKEKKESSDNAEIV